MSALLEASYDNYESVSKAASPRATVVVLNGASPPPRMRKFPKQTRSRLMVMSIKQAALELVTRRQDGDELKVINIADTCGISTGSLYQYFNCLESILAAVYEDIILEVLRLRGTEVITPQDFRILTRRLTQLDRLFGRHYFEEFYAQYLRPSRCACDVALTFVNNFGCYQSSSKKLPLYWEPYISVE